MPIIAVLLLATPCLPFLTATRGCRQAQVCGALYGLGIVLWAFGADLGLAAQITGRGFVALGVLRSLCSQRELWTAIATRRGRD